MVNGTIGRTKMYRKVENQEEEGYIQGRGQANMSGRFNISGEVVQH